MRQPKSHGFSLPEFATALAALALFSAIFHPVLVQARTASTKPSSFHSNTAFQMYAVDFDGGSGDFEGKPVLIDNMKAKLALYGVRRAAPRHAHRTGLNPATGCMPILKFEPVSYVASTGDLTYWEGSVGNAMSGCTIYPAVVQDSVLMLPDWDSVPTDEVGNFWLVAGAVDSGVGTVAVETETGATASDSVLVLDN